MAKKTPKDKYDDLPPEEERFGYPGGFDDDLTDEERQYSFDEEYADAPARAQERVFDYEKEQEAYLPEKKPFPLAGIFRKKTSAETALTVGEKLQALTQKLREKPRAPKSPKGKIQYGEQAPVTVDMELRPDQMLVYDSELDEIDYTDEEDMPELRDYMPIRFRRYGRVGIGGGILYALFVISASVVLACLAWLFASDVLALNKEANNAIVTIERYEPGEGDPTENSRGETIKVDIDQVSTALKNAGIIEYKWLFKIFSRVAHAEAKITPGTYDVSTELDYRAIVTALQFGSGKQETTQITFPEGFTVEQVFTLLEENQICEKSELYETAANYEFDYSFLEGLEYGDENRLEGFLFPDTYEFYQGESAAVAISRFLNNFQNKVTADIQSTASGKGFTVKELVTFASLIEKEAGSDDERGNIASAIQNRLNAGWKLQLDSTINYIKGTSTFNLYNSDLEIESPYNTYLYEGLPIGPICSPGLASIKAVIDHPSTDYWFWYAVDGESTFFTNQSDFDAFVAANPY